MPRDKVLKAQRTNTTIARQDGMPLGWRDLSFHPSSLGDIEGAERGQVVTGQGSPANWQGLALGALGQALVAGAVDPSWTDVGLSAGVVVAPTIEATDPADGTYIVGTGTYRLYKTTDGLGEIATFTVAGGTLAPTENDPHYLTVSYNAGAPVVSHTTDRSTINGFSVIGIATVYRIGTTIDILPWGTFGTALSTKLNARHLSTGIERQSGLTLSEAATRLVNISAGVCWLGATQIALDAFATGTSGHTLREWIWDGATWTPTEVSAYENAYYQGSSGKVAATGNKYLVLWVYRKLTAGNLVAGYILGTAEYASLAGAQAAAQPTPPEAFAEFGVLVGRIIIQNGASSATEIAQAYSSVFAWAQPANHNELLGLQGGAAGAYYHASALTVATSKVFAAGDYTASGSMTWTVESGEVVTLAYIIIDKLMVVWWDLVGTDVGGTVDSELRIAIPASKVAAVAAENQTRVSDNGTPTQATASVSASGTVIAITRNDGAAFSAAAGTTDASGVLLFLIQ